jgi:hypothetical protein
MSQRGRGSGPEDDDLTGEDAGRDRDAPGSRLPSSSRPIAPYDPYRSSSSSMSRPSRDATEPFEPVARPSSAMRDADPFLPDDDPLSAEAWQLEFDDEPYPDDLGAPPEDFDTDSPPPPRRPRRQPQRAARGARVAETPASARRASRRGSEPATTIRERLPRGAGTIAIPRAVSGSSLVADQTALAMLAVNVASIVIMALLLGVRVGGIPSPTVLHLDAAGNPDRWGPASVLWRLPLMAFFLTLMFTAVAWFLHPIDRFAARFALGAAAVTQLVAWVAVIQHISG